jgi:hypothetical protein
MLMSAFGRRQVGSGGAENSGRSIQDMMKTASPTPSGKTAVLNRKKIFEAVNFLLIMDQLLFKCAKKGKSSGE